MTLLSSPLTLSLNWSVCLGLGSVCGGNYSVPNKSVVLIQTLPAKMLVLVSYFVFFLLVSPFGIILLGGFLEMYLVLRPFCINKKGLFRVVSLYS